MASGTATSFEELPHQIASLLDIARRAVMTTIATDGSPHSVPVVFARVGDELISPIDHKPKSGKVLARVNNIERDDRITLLIDHWDEDWKQLAWLMIRARAVVDADAPMDVVQELNERYPQYAINERHDALIHIQPTRLSWWAWSDLS